MNKKTTLTFSLDEFNDFIKESLEKKYGAEFGKFLSYFFRDDEGNETCLPQHFSARFEEVKKTSGKTPIGLKEALTQHNPVRRKKGSNSDPLVDWLISPVESLGLSKIIKNFLSKDGILYIWQLVVLSDAGLLNIRGIGHSTMSTIRRRLKLLLNQDDNFNPKFRSLFLEWVEKKFGSTIPKPGSSEEVKSITNFIVAGLSGEVHQFIHDEVPKMKTK